MRHGIRIASIWIAVSIIVELLIAVLPIPSPANSPEAIGDHQTVYMLFYVGGPIFVFVWVLFLYNIFVFRRRAGDDVERPAPPDSAPILLLWAGISFVIVLFLAGWGTFTLHEVTAAPHETVEGQASSTRHGKTTTAPVQKPGRTLDVQVIGQQWAWTFRYPSFGGMETRDLTIPVNTPIHLHITSLDVVHSFWSYDYDVKEDAVPGVENTAWLFAKNLSSYSDNGQNWIKCNELCGLRHGYMRSGLYVISQSSFATWAKKQLQSEKSSGLLKNLPPYSSVYYPTSNSNWPTAPQDQSP
ncbi:MAG: cytochrome c oxidase subunit II [Chloroflexota bacterium]